MNGKKKEFYEKFKNMQPMRYYEAALTHNKAKEMVSNKDNQFFAMRKYDGEWCRAIIMEDEVLLQSRSISKVTGTYGDKTALVPHIVEELKEHFPAGTVLLGELAFDDFESTSREVGSILRCKAPKAIERQKDKKLHFFVFDVLAYEYKDLTDIPFSERFLVYPGFGKSEYVGVPMNTNSDFMEFAEWVWGHGGEGIMIMREDAPYQPGKRTAWLSLKVKKKLGELEVQIIGFIEPNRIYEGSEIDNWKYFVDKNDKPADLAKMIDYGELTAVTKPYYYGWKNGVIISVNGNLVRVTSGLSDDFREWFATEEANDLMSLNRLYAKVTGMEFTEGSIRHPVFLDVIIK